ncbi:hypothetical protein VCR15J5_480007 [Vibrio crassostreae]|nr:hypothetical protein VCR15J5_480007 [Vibrio crassostreae]
MGGGVVHPLIGRYSFRRLSHKPPFSAYFVIVSDLGLTRLGAVLGIVQLTRNLYPLLRYCSISS